MNNRRTRANSAPLNARVTLELANRLRQHLADQGYRSLSDFVTAAIEEKLARESLDNAEHAYWPTLNARPAADTAHNPSRSS